MAEERQLARTITNAQRAEAFKILGYIETEVERIAAGDEDLAFRLRRFIHARVHLKNRGTTQQRDKLRKAAFAKQQGRCPVCHQAFLKLTDLDMHRTTPGRYTEANTVLMHRECHQQHHQAEGSVPEAE